MNEENNNEIDLRIKVLDKIKSGEVSMHSKAYFLFKLGVLIVLTVLVTVTSIFLLSFIIYSSSLDGSLFLMRFGGIGFYNFFLTLPWILLVIDVLLLFVLDILLKSFRFGYKSPVVYLFIGTIFTATIVSTLVNFTSFHQIIMSKVENKKFPFVSNIYSEVSSQHQKPGTWKGYVGEINGNSFKFKYIKNIKADMGYAEVFAVEEITVVDKLKEGDLVFVAGSILDNRIMAYGIKKLNK